MESEWHGAIHERRIDWIMKITNYGLVAVLALGTFLTTGSQALAQEKKAEQKKHFTASERQPGDRMAEELKLTDEQKTKIRTFREEQRKKAEEIRKDTSLTPEQKREKSVALRKEGDAKMKEILTAEQYAKWEKNDNRKRGPAATPGERGQKKGHKKEDKKD
jgi:Spy/CpxP family protein refolding chaperone